MKNPKHILMIAALCATTAMAQTPPKSYKAYMVANAHLDTQWNWDVQTTIKEYLPNTLYQNFKLFEMYPNYIFNFEGAVKYAWFKEYYPEEYKRLKEYIKTGQWHISGSSWDANDPNVPSPESFFRNILLGQEFYKKEFGIKSTDIFLPDCFGFSYTMPSVAAHCGLIGFSTQKLAWRNNPFHGEKKYPFEFGLWQGVDGSRIMAAFNGEDYTWNPDKEITNDQQLINNAKNAIAPIAFRYYGTRSSKSWGDRGGSPYIWAVKAIEESANGSGPVDVSHATSDRLFKEYHPFEKHPELPVFDGELLMDVHATGCYTSQAAMKRFNRRNEQLADAAERAAVMADWMGALPYPKEEINNSWQRFIWHQFHDDLTGTSIPSVYTFSWNDELISQSRFTQVLTTASGSVANLLNTKSKGTAMIVYNSTAYARSGLVEANIAVNKNITGIAVYDPNGERISAQLIDCKNGIAHILFSAQCSPMSYSVYDIRPATKDVPTKSLKASKNTIENGVYKVTVDINGDISSIVDKRSGRELVEPGRTFGLALFKENKSEYWPAWEILKSSMEVTPVKVNQNVKISIAELGAVRAALKVEREYEGSTFVQYIRLTEGADDDRIDIMTDVDWKTKKALLKAEFPMSISNPMAVYDLGIGSIERGNNTATAYEVCAQQWAGITNQDHSYGISILNNCKYGWDKPNDNTLRMTLLHTPAINNSYTHQGTLDLGRHQFAYSIIGHEGDYKKAGIVAKAEKMNNPLFAFTSSKHEGKLGKKFSFVSTNTPQIAIKALKKAEDGNGYIIRIHETEGKSVDNAQILFHTEIESACETNGIEEKTGTAKFDKNTLIVDASRFAPKTYRVTLKARAEKEKPTESVFIDLPYNTVAISSDAFSALGKIDNDYHSFADEIMPTVIETGGVKFKRGTADYPNAVQCKGDTIQLPSGKVNKLYLLVTSTEKDRIGDFWVDEKKYTIEIPYFAGFYGQWGWEGISESYIRNGELAYVGDHTHHAEKRNLPYTQSYLYKVVLDIPAGAEKLVLPDDRNIVLFAATASNNKADNVKLAHEPRALPK